MNCVKCTDEVDELFFDGLDSSKKTICKNCLISPRDSEPFGIIKPVDKDNKK